VGLAGLSAFRPVEARALSEADERIYRQAFQAARSGKWSYVKARASKAKDPLLAKTLLWVELSQPQRRAGFAKRAKFVEDNPTWPDLDLLERLAEESMGDDTPDDVVLDWFAKHEATTGHGLMRYGEALKRTGETAKAESVLRQAWVEGDFGLREERTFLARHRKTLRAEDHIARLDRLLWEGRYHSARRMVRRVDKGHQALAEARLRLRRMEGGVDWAIRQVPDELRKDPGLMYERLRWRRRRGRDESAREILEDPPDDLVRPQAWWAQRAIIARRALAAGDISVAYRLAGDHGLTGGAGYVEGEWLAGWIALGFLDDRRVAFEHFTNAHEAAKYPISRARGAYWAGRAAEALREPALAEEWFRRAGQHVTTYHGQLAAAKLEQGQGLALPSEPTASAADITTFEGRELVQVVRQLGQIGERRRLKPFILRLQEIAETPGEMALAGDLALKQDRPDLAVRTAKLAIRSGVTLIGQGYPIPYELDGEESERALLLAVTRQESMFDSQAHSGAGARGLMQIMPGTARTMARRLKVKYSTKKLKSDPAYNLKLGRAYILTLLERYDRSYVLALAAYNAGPARVRRWLRDFGDPRSPDVDAIDWIELIPFSETRDYVHRVLANLQVYRLRLGLTTVAVSLEADLHLTD
jgi:soluble lytic murein transglycosylase